MLLLFQRHSSLVIMDIKDRVACLLIKSASKPFFCYKNAREVATAFDVAKKSGIGTRPIESSAMNVTLRATDTDKRHFDLCALMASLALYGHSTY